MIYAVIGADGSVRLVSDWPSVLAVCDWMFDHKQMVRRIVVRSADTSDHELQQLSEVI